METQQWGNFVEYIYNKINNRMNLLVHNFMI